jgi:glyoxylase I family protein
MESLAEWRVTDTGWIQVTLDPGRAGNCLLNFAVDDLGKNAAELSSWGLPPGEIETVNKDVQLSVITDPDGSRITFIGNFRIKY